MGGYEEEMKIAFLGLGVMGAPMAGHLQGAGYEVCVYNRTLTKAQAWQARYQGRVAECAREAVRGAEVVLLCLGRDEDVLEVVLGEEGALAGMAEGAVLVDHSTTSAVLAERLAGECGAKGVDFLDAPVSGGQAGAENGALSVMVGGEAQVLARVRPVLDCYASVVTHIGAHGDGQRCKMVNQMAISGILQGLAEALTFAKEADLALDKVLAAISGGAAGSWQLSNRGQTMCADEFDFGFAIEWMVKDLGYAIAEAKRQGTAVRLNEEVLARYRWLCEQGYQRADTSVLIKAVNYEQ